VTSRLGPPRKPGSPVFRLELRPGLSLLDVGRGTGDDALGLARLLGPSGRVVGIDSSDELATWWADLETAGAEQRLHAGIFGFVVAGRKP
jgi:tRNA A58 N-methylase Trm61